MLMFLTEIETADASALSPAKPAPALEDVLEGRSIVEPAGDVMIRKPTDGPKAGEGKRSTRARLVGAAVSLFQQRGLHAIGLSEILAEAKAPKGSLYHHFPGGKDELAVAAVQDMADAILQALDRLDGQDDFGLSDFLEYSATETGRRLAANDWRDGSLLAMVGQQELDADSKIGDAVRIAYQRIEMRLAKLLVGEGVALAQARDLAATIIASQEGALALARSRRDAAPLTLVAEMLTTIIEARAMQARQD